MDRELIGREKHIIIRDDWKDCSQTELWREEVTDIKLMCTKRNACYHSVQNILSSRLPSKNLKIKIYRTIVLPVVLYGCEAWSLTLREERKLRVFENIWTWEGRGKGGMEEIA